MPGIQLLKGPVEVFKYGCKEKENNRQADKQRFGTMKLSVSCFPDGANYECRRKCYKCNPNGKWNSTLLEEFGEQQYTATGNKIIPDQFRSSNRIKSGQKNSVINKS